VWRAFNRYDQSRRRHHQNSVRAETLKVIISPRRRCSFACRGFPLFSCGAFSAWGAPQLAASSSSPQRGIRFKRNTGGLLVPHSFLLRKRFAFSRLGGQIPDYCGRKFLSRKSQENGGGTAGSFQFVSSFKCLRHQRNFKAGWWHIWSIEDVKKLRARQI